MEIKDITEEVAFLKRRQAFEERLDSLTKEQSVFALKALLICGHVSPDTMTKALDLIDTIRSNG